METIISSLIILMLVVFSVSSYSSAIVESQQLTADGWQAAQARVAEQNSTSIAFASQEAGIDYIDATLLNDGDTSLANMHEWDIFISAYNQAGSLIVTWLPYEQADTFGNWWQDSGLYMDAAGGSPEVYEPKVFNPGEELVIRIWLPGGLQSDSAVMLNIVTDSGAQARTIFTQ